MTAKIAKKSSKKSTRKSSKKTTRKSKRGRAPDLSPSERRIVKRMTEKGATMRKIAAKIHRAPSTIWRHQQNPI